MILSTIEKKAEQAENLDSFSGIKILHIKKKIAELLGLIGRFEIFNQYTKHDITHIDQLLALTEWVIPDQTKNKLTPADCLLMVLSIYFHDLGMLVTTDEYSKRNQTKFLDYKNKILSGDFGFNYKSKIDDMKKESEDDAERFLYQEFIRAKHAERIKFWVQGKQEDSLGITNKVVDEINNLLKPLPAKFRLDLSLICESHHLSDLDNFEKYNVSFPYGKSEEETANMHYAALILRTVDLLHITSDRTPSIEFRLIAPSDPVSQIEWIKQMAVTNVRGKVKRDKEGKVDHALTKDTVEITAFFDQPEKSDAFFSLMAYLKYAKKELVTTFNWAEIAQKEHGTKDYLFPWKNIDDENVQTQGFERELFQFNLDQAKILNLLVGHTLYNDSTVVLRELIQNSIDAIRLYIFTTNNNNNNIKDHEIEVKYNSINRLLDITDTGTGMSRTIIKNHLLKVGSSRYQDDSFKKDYPDFNPISRFGIGVLTCFLISDEIEILTITQDDSDALNLTIKDVDGKYLLRSVSKENLGKQIRDHGTRIRLKVRSEIEMDNLISDIKKWIIFPPCSLKVEIDNNDAICIGYNSPKAALEEYLRKLDYNFNSGEIKVVESEKNGIVLAYGLQYSKYFKEWRILTTTEDKRDNVYNPIGTSVEGIRVEFNTPGFNEKRLVAIANAKGKNAPKTNVARSNIESTTWLENVYDLYAEYVQNEIHDLNKKQGFSVTWATMETSYLLQPFGLYDSYETRNEITDNTLWSNSLNKIDGLLIETDKKRKAVSVEFLRNKKEIVTIDCDLFRSAESMLKEVPSDASLIGLLEALYGKDGIDYNTNNVLLCSYNPLNTLHSSLFQNQEVTKIILKHEMRRADLVWSKKEPHSHKWLDISKEVANFRRIGRLYGNQFEDNKILIQNDNVDIEGLNNEIAIGAFYQYYLLKGSPIHEYIVNHLNTIRENLDVEKILTLKFLLDITGNLLSRSSSSNISEVEIDKVLEKFFDSDNRRNSLYRENLIWNYLNKTDFITNVKKTQWRVYDTQVWERPSYDRYQFRFRNY